MNNIVLKHVNLSIQLKGTSYKVHIPFTGSINLDITPALMDKADIKSSITKLFKQLKICMIEMVDRSFGPALVEK